MWWLKKDKNEISDVCPIHVYNNNLIFFKLTSLYCTVRKRGYENGRTQNKTEFHDE
jgi:hypothetical protein